MANVRIKIPDSPSPVYTVTINGVKYSYPSGKTMQVPDYVADVIRYSEDSKPKPGVPGDPADYDPTGFTAHVRIIPSEESAVPIDSAFLTKLVSKMKFADNPSRLAMQFLADTSFITKSRMRAIFDEAVDVYVSKFVDYPLPFCPDTTPDVFAGGEYVDPAETDLDSATIYGLLKDKDDKSILVITNYPQTENA